MANLRVQRRPASGRREGGASLVEFALVSPLLFMLLFGTLTGGLTLSRQNAVNNAVRETTRLAAVFPDFDDTGNAGDMYAQVVAAATGDLNVGVPNRRICVALIDGTSWTYEEYTTAAMPSSAGTAVAIGSVPATCKEGYVGIGGGKQVWVRAQRDSDITAIIYNQNVTLQAQSLTRYERG